MRRCKGKDLRTKTDSNTKGITYFKVMLTLFILLSLIIVIALFYLWNVLSEYESTTPRTALDTYFSQLANNDYDVIKESSEFITDEFNTWDDYINLLHTTFGESPKNFTYKQIVGNSAVVGQMYSILDGTNEFGYISLVADKGYSSGWAVSMPLPSLTNYTITAPSYVNIFVDEIELLPNEHDAIYTPLQSSENTPEGVPIASLIQYNLSLLSEPVFSATSPTDTVCEIITDDETNEVTINVLPNGEQQAVFSAHIEAFAKSLATFITGDSSYSALANYLYPSAPISKQLQQFYSGWYIAHAGYKFTDIEVSDIYYTTESTFNGNIQFNHHILNDPLGKNHVYFTHYNMTFALHNGAWLLIDLQIRG